MIEKITIHNPSGYVMGEFPITNSCERSAKLMGDDYVRLVFNLDRRVVFDAFSFIEYNGQTFFLKERYAPSPNGARKETINGEEWVLSQYAYDVKFVSIGNMLDKFICYRHVVVGEQSWDEPEIAINGTLETLYVIVMGAIKQAAERLNQGWFFTALLHAIYNNGIAVVNGVQQPNTEKVKLTAGTKLLTFNFNGENIANVCTTIANNFTKDDKKDTEWYISSANMNTFDSCTMHFAKCVNEQQGAQVISDYTTKNVGHDSSVHPYKTGGLKKVEYAQAWSGITNVLVPYGSDRNMSYYSVKGIDEITKIQSTFGKRLRLKPNYTYKVKGKDGNEVQINTDAHGAIRNELVNTGIEQVKFYDHVYPQCHFKVTSVDVRNKRQDGETVPEYTITADPISTNKEALTEDGFYPIKIEEATTLSVRFESGFLNGREFEIANKTTKDENNTSYSLKFTIVADGSIEDGTLIPSGNFIPHIGDEFALFNMKMPSIYVTYAENELAQEAYNELIELQTTRPEVKCTTDPVSWNNPIDFGYTFKVQSELFSSEDSFVSRVISYSYKLTTPNNVQFSLASAIMQGTLSTMNSLISDVTNTTGGLTQRAINLSRRAWRDASEVAEMLDSITAEMMLVGNEKYQFAFSSGVEVGNGELHIGYGSLQHTQSPYIEYVNSGLWEISAQTITTGLVDGVEMLLHDQGAYDKSFYLYAVVADNTEPAQLELSTTDHAKDTEYLLLGILSSEYEGERVFSRTNGFTAIAGGTITTEQIQDANRRLIIDFQSNPPCIIARDGAEIKGKFTFLSGKDVESEINAYDYLKQALAKGSTDIHGGLVATNLLQLKDLNNRVRAGLSGLADDNILLWGGGSYDDALALADGDLGTDINTLIFKDGTGRIGVFNVNRDNIRVSTTDGTVVIDDNDGMRCMRPNESEPVVKVTPSELPSLEMMRGENKETNLTLEVLEQRIVGADNEDFTLETMHYEVPFYCGKNTTITINGGIDITSMSGDTEFLNILDEQEADDLGRTNETGLHVNIYKNGVLLHNGVVGYAYRNTLTFYLEEGGEYMIEYYAKVKCLYYGNGDDVTAKVVLKGGASFKSTYIATYKQTTIAYKGVFSYQGENAYLYYKDGVGLECKVGNSIFNVKDDTIECKVGNTNLVLIGNGIKAIGLPDIEPTEEGMIYKDTLGYLKIK